MEKTSDTINILLIEDDDFDRELIRRNLLESDLIHDLTDVRTVDQGIAEVQTNNYDVIFLDYHLPGKSGVELLKYFKQYINSRRVAVIIISLTDDEEKIFECLNLGAQDFISKANISPLGLKRALFNAQVKSNLEANLFNSNLKLKQLAEIDTLTGIFNRYYFNNHLDEYFTSSEIKHSHALILLDIDNFKTVNDTYGHNTGDELLIKFADIIKNTLPDNILFARLGGDEFAIFMDERIYQTQLACQAIYKALESYVTFGDAYQQISVSIGYATTPGDAIEYLQLFQFADLALYYSKNSKIQNAYGFSLSMFKASQERTALKTNIEEAYKNNGFSVHYQPIVNSSDKSLIGFEALMRLKNEQGYIPPDKFIKVLEQMKLIHEIGYRLIEEVLKQHAKWLKKSNNKFRISINLSPVQLNDGKIIEFIFNNIRKYKIEPNFIMFELTETVLLDNPLKVSLILSKISDFGCRIALDDFGTGFSSLTHLKEFPIDTVKIDKSMIPQNKHDHKSINIIKGLTTMLKTMGLEIVAEGIETEFQMRLCKELEVTSLQGYLFDKPLKSDTIDKKYFSWKEKLFKRLNKI